MVDGNLEWIAFGSALFGFWWGLFAVFFFFFFFGVGKSMDTRDDLTYMKFAI